MPHLLSIYYKPKCKRSLKNCLKVFKRNSIKFLYRFEAVNETWFHFCTPENRQQSKQRVFPSEPVPKKAKVSVDGNSLLECKRFCTSNELTDQTNAWTLKNSRQGAKHTKTGEMSS